MRLNRRKLFVISVWVGGVILAACPFAWYAVNLPLPAKAHGWYGHPVGDWFLETREDILWKKFSARTMKLHLPGTRWLDVDSGAIAEFGADGKFRWIARPYPTTKIEKFETDAICTRVDRTLEEKIHLAPFTIRLHRNQFMSWDGKTGSGHIGENIFFETPLEMELKAIVGSDGRSLGFTVWTSGDKMQLIFERQVSDSAPKL